MLIIIIAGNTLIGKVVAEELSRSIADSESTGKLMEAVSEDGSEVRMGRISVLTSADTYDKATLPRCYGTEKVIVVDLGGKLDRTEAMVKELDANLILNLQPYYLKTQRDDLNLKKRFGDRLKVILSPVQDWFSPISHLPKKDTKAIFDAVKVNRSEYDGIQLIKYMGTIPEIKITPPKRTARKTVLAAYAYEDRDDYDWSLVYEALKSYSVLLIADPTFQECYIPNAINKHPEFSMQTPTTYDEACTSLAKCKGMIHLPTMTNRSMTSTVLPILLAPLLDTPCVVYGETPLVSVRASITGTTTTQDYRRTWSELMTGMFDPAGPIRNQVDTITCEAYPGIFVGKYDDKNSLSGIVCDLVTDMVSTK